MEITSRLSGCRRQTCAKASSNTFLRFVEKKNPETKQPERNPYDFGFYLINPADNRENLDPKYLALLDSLPEKARNRFLLGKFADDSEGALWTEELLAIMAHGPSVHTDVVCCCIGKVAVYSQRSKRGAIPCVELFPQLLRG